ncbi:MAG: diaminopimelate decarboxylase [Candidatus Saccharimonadaceae bacterium]
MILKSIETPAYIIRKNILKESIESFKIVLNKNFSKSILSYSLKTNSLPYVLKMIKYYNAYAEVVSHDEYELAKLIGFKIENIVYNGPLKSKETFLEALKNGAIVNIETKLEIEWLKDLPQDISYSIGIRINIDLGLISPEDAKEDEYYSRFGFSVENGEFKNALLKLSEFANVKLKGLHVHRTTQTRSIDIYEKIGTYVGYISNKYSLSLSYVDMGGGFYGIMDNKPSFQDYCNAIKKGLKKNINLENLTIIVEPGSAIAASAIDFISSVVDVKKIRDFYVITTDGSRNDVDPFYRKKNYFYEIVSDDLDEEKVSLQIVCGGTCLENDKMFKINDKSLLQVGDKILYKKVGAYTMSLSPLFIRFFPDIYIEENDNYCLARKKWSASDFFNIYDTIDI